LNLAWFVGGIALAGIVIALIVSWYGRDRSADLGTVSQQWIAEQRSGSTRDRNGG
jgi:hypothetical protein